MSHSYLYYILCILWYSVLSVANYREILKCSKLFCVHLEVFELAAEMVWTPLNVGNNAFSVLGA